MSPLPAPSPAPLPNPTATVAEPWSTTPLRAQSLPLLAISPALPSPTLPLPHHWTTAMVLTSGGHRFKPRVRFSTPERGDAVTSRATDAHSPNLSVETQPALASAAIPEEPQATEPPSRRYQTRVGPRPPSPVHQRRRKRAPPSKRTWTSGPGESLRSRP